MTTTFANVDSDIIRIFILRLIHKLEADGLNVETEVLFLLDNASYHTSGIVRRFFEIYNLNIAWQDHMHMRAHQWRRYFQG